MIRLEPGGDLLGRFSRELLGGEPLLSPGAGPSLEGYAEQEVRAAHLAWTERIVDEYRSVVVFAELLQRLGECEAPFETLAAVHRLLGDELRHTALCARVAGWFGRRPPQDGPPGVGQSVPLVVAGFPREHSVRGPRFRLERTELPGG
jgi:hypothetical protein